MSWLNKVRNSLPFIQKRDTTDTLWIKCPGCGETLFIKDYEDNLSVCPQCGHHGRIGTDTRLDQIMDPGFILLPAPVVREDPLKFRDSKRYTDRLKTARSANAHTDAYTNAFGTIEGKSAVVGVQDFGFMGGSMGMAVGNAIVAGIERAIREGCAYVAITAAGGARMQEGILSLMQMPRTTVAISRLHAATRHVELAGVEPQQHATLLRRKLLRLVELVLDGEARPQLLEARKLRIDHDHRRLDRSPRMLIEGPAEHRDELGP